MKWLNLCRSSNLTKQLLKYAIPEGNDFNLPLLLQRKRANNLKFCRICNCFLDLIPCLTAPNYEITPSKPMPEKKKHWKANNDQKLRKCDCETSLRAKRLRDPQSKVVLTFDINWPCNKNLSKFGSRIS